MRRQSPSRLTSFLVVAALLLASSCDPFTAVAAAESSAPGVGGSRTPIAGPAQCESRTINYITHTLPQQCLRTNWPGQDLTAAAGGTAPVDVQNATAGEEQAPDKGKDKDKAKGVVEDDDGQDLATSSFMSFEEWKELQLRKSGQDPADLQARKKQEHRGDGYSGSSNGNLDSLDDDGEISLDFDALSEKVSELTSGSGPAADSPREEARARDAVLYDDGRTQYYRSKDAGKTCKERFSYASFDAGATVLKTSAGAKNAKAILVENKDSYMLLECNTQNKYFIVELSDDILVDTVVLANFEFFSSMIRRFRVSVSDRYPVKLEKWKELGVFEARNSRDIQPFLIEHPQIWAKYIRIELLTHYGNEYYCPVSLFRVHGTRMLDSWKESEGGREDDDETFESVQDVVERPQAAVSETVVEEPPKEIVAHQEYEPFSAKYELSPWNPIFYTEASSHVCPVSLAPTETSPSPPTNGEDGQASSGDASANTTPPSKEGSTSSNDAITKTSRDSAQAQQASASSSRSTVNAGSGPTSYPSPDTIKNTQADNSNASDRPTQSAPPSKPAPTSSTSTPAAASQQPKASNNHNNNNKAQPSSTRTTQRSHKPTTLLPKPSHQQHHHHASSRNRTSSSSSTPSEKGGSNANGGSGSPPQPPNPSPTVQESFFKSITKRLQLLESNTSLSLQYIEDQSLFLREALGKMERRQIARVDAFLDSLNGTVLAELRAVRQQYDQVWQSTVIALESQRERSEREIVALSDRLSLLADEVVFQKRMAILQAVLLLSCLVLVIFSRGIAGSSFVFGGDSRGGAAALLDLALLHQYGGGAMMGSPTTSPYRGGVGGSGAGDARARALSRSKSYPDKVLPLTPTSESASREGSPPTAQPAYFEEEEKTWNSSKADSLNDMAVDGASSMQQDKSEEQVHGECEGEEIRPIPTITTTSLVGTARKPLPALPEDPS